MFTRWLQRQWFEQRRLSPALWLLLPLTGLFIGLAALKRYFTKPEKLSVPVIVVGNITVGGAGKTPLTLWLAQQLAARGLKPGIVSRGYGGENTSPRAVSLAASPAQVGDEPLLLARRSGVPVWVARDRSAAGRALLAIPVGMYRCWGASAITAIRTIPARLRRSSSSSRSEFVRRTWKLSISPSKLVQS